MGTITTTSFNNTPQAKDDYYGLTEDQLAAMGFSGTTVVLDVMSNDLGGAAKKLYSIDDGSGNAVDASQLMQADGLVNGVSAWETTAGGNLIRINNGKIEIDVSHSLAAEGATSLNALGANDTIQDSFTYAIRLANGTLSWATVRINITGVNDQATITDSGHEDTSVVEAGGVANGTLADPDAGGVLTVNDVDGGENHFAAVPAASLDGFYGSFTFNAVTGAWSFKLDQTKADALKQGEHVQQSLTVQSADGTATRTITVDITGSNDAPKVSADVTGSATEGGSSVAVDALANAGDVDADAVLAVVGVPAGLPAGVSYDAVNHTFTLDPSDAAYQHLKEGATTTVEVSYGVSDGIATTPAKVVFTVTGTNDVPTVSGELSANANEGDAAFTKDLLAGASDADDGETATLAVANVTYSVDDGGASAVAPAGVSLSGSTLSVDPANGAFNHLAEGATSKIVVSYDVTDVHGAKVAQTETITITGTNDKPVVAAALSAAANEGDAAFTKDLLAGASDADDGETATLAVVNVTYSVDDGGASAVAPAGVSLLGSKLSVDPANGAFNHLAAGATTKIVVSYEVEDVHGATVAQTETVTITGTNDAPDITSDGGGASAAIGVDENSTAVTTVAAGDVDLGSTLTYSIDGGADAARFTIDALTGVLQFVTAPDFEAPTDAGADNVYDVVVRVSDGDLSDTQALAVTVNPVNDNAPVITSNGGGAIAAVSVNENTTAVTTVVAADADLPAGALVYSIVGGADSAKFSIDAGTGLLSFVNAPNFESPTDAGSSNVYDVTVQVSDGAFTDTQAIAVNVQAQNEFAPVITSNGGSAEASISVAENSTAVTTVTATDADLPAAALAYSIVGGADAAKFTINSATGALAFLSAPDFEAPADAGGNNVYDVKVEVSDGTLVDTQDIAVTVTNVAEQVDTYSIGQNDGTKSINDTDGGDDTLFVHGTPISPLNFERVNNDLVITTGQTKLTIVDQYVAGHTIETITFDSGASAYGISLGSYNLLTSTSGTNAADVVAGSGSADPSMTGGNTGDLVFGNAGNDSLSGGAGADLLVGGDGNDSLTGNNGGDIFVFNVAANSTSNHDTITSFDNNDVIWLSDAVFSGLTTNGSAAGTDLLAADFKSVAGSGSSTNIGTAHLVYDSTTGNLFYDANGGDGTGRELVVTLTGNPTLTAGDIQVGL